MRIFTLVWYIVSDRYVFWEWRYGSILLKGWTSIGMDGYQFAWAGSEWIATRFTRTVYPVANGSLLSEQVALHCKIIAKACASLLVSHANLD